MNQVHPKVTAATIASGVVGVLLALLEWTQKNPDILGQLPKWLQGLLLLIVPPLATFLAGYMKSSQPIEKEVTIGDPSNPPITDK